MPTGRPNRAKRLERSGLPELLRQGKAGASFEIHWLWPS